MSITRLVIYELEMIYRGVPTGRITVEIATQTDPALVLETEDAETDVNDPVQTPEPSLASVVERCWKTSRKFAKRP